MDDGRAGTLSENTYFEELTPQQRERPGNVNVKSGEIQEMKFNMRVIMTLL